MSRSQADTAGRLVAALATPTRGLFAVACGALVVMLAAYVTEVVSRYFFDAPTRWASDVVSYAMLACVAFALPAVTRDAGHVAITSLVERLAPRAQQRAHRLLAWISAASCVGAAALLTWQAAAQAAGDIETVAALAIPKWWLSGAVAIGFGGAAVHFVAHALQHRAAALGGEREP